MEVLFSEKLRFDISCELSAPAVKSYFLYEKNKTKYLTMFSEMKGLDQHFS